MESLDLKYRCFKNNLLDILNVTLIHHSERISQIAILHVQ